MAPGLVRSVDKHEDIVIDEQMDSLEIDFGFDEDIEVETRKCI